MSESQVVGDQLRQARDALRLILPMAKGYAAAHPVGSNAQYIEEAEAAIEALAVPVGQQEPVAWMRKGTKSWHGEMHNFRLVNDRLPADNWTPLYTHPPVSVGQQPADSEQPNAGTAHPAEVSGEMAPPAEAKS